MSAAILVVAGTVGVIMLEAAGARWFVSGTSEVIWAIVETVGTIIFEATGDYAAIWVFVGTYTSIVVIIGNIGAISGAFSGVISSPGSRRVLVGTIWAIGGAVGAVVYSAGGGTGLTYLECNVLFIIKLTPISYLASI